MNLIDVYWTGRKYIFGGEESSLEAHEIYCDNCNNCSLYKNKQCLNHCPPFASPCCKLGSVINTKGYTSRAQKYSTFKSRYTSNDKYNCLTYPNTKNLAIIGDTVFIYLTYAKVELNKETNNYYTIRSNYICESSYVPIDKFNTDLIYNIATFKPRALLGGVITDYNDKIIPDFLLSLKKLMPAIYNEFITEYPEWNLAPNYIGKVAYVNSLKSGTKFIEHNTEWLYDGEYVIAENMDLGLSSPWWQHNNDSENIVKIKVNDKMTITINDNSIVDENTKFK